MPLRIYLSLLAGTLLAAVGQVLFKLGASGRDEIASFLNAWIFAGVIAYGLGTILWIYSLSKAKLTVVYPFTALTFALVYLFGVFVLDEAPKLGAMLGVVLILCGLFLIAIYNN
jgi:drug/metabolite transporter (DMT)-like permease